MITEVKNETVPYILSDAARNAYEKIKALILRIFTMLKRHKKDEDLKKEFYDTYIDFARKLDENGCHKLSTSYMAICEMYYSLIDRDDDLVAHESFFIDLFNAFDNILQIKIDQAENYDEEYNQFLVYRRKMQEYFYRNLATPSPHFNRDALDEITSNLSGDL